SRRCTRCDLDLDRYSTQSRHLDLGAEGRLIEADRQVHAQIVAVPGEDRVRLHMHGQDHIAGLAAVRTGLALAGQTDLLSVLDPDRGAHGQRLPAGHVQLHRGAVDGFGEGQGRARLDVATLDRRLVAAVSAATADTSTESAEAIGEVRGHVSPAAVGGAGPRPSAAPEEVGEHALESAAGSTAGSSRTGAEAGSAAHGANLIVLGAGLLVGQHLMRLSDLLELLLG